MSIRFDKTDGGGSFPLLPEDRYTLQCTDAKLGQSAAGNPKISATFDILDGEFAGKRKVFNDFSLVPAAIFNILGYFEAAGIEIKTDVDYEEEELVKMLLTTKVSGYVGTRTHKGKKFNSVSNWKALETANDLFV